MFQHFDFALVNVIDDVLSKLIGNVDGNTTDTTERLEDFANFGLLESVGQMMRDGFRDDRVPAFLIELDSFFES